MKIQTTQLRKPTARSRPEQGMAVIAVMVIVSILLIYIAGNVRTLHLLQRDLRQVEQKQVSRLQAKFAATNALPGTNLPVAVPIAPCQASATPQAFPVPSISQGR